MIAFILKWSDYHWSKKSADCSLRYGRENTAWIDQSRKSIASHKENRTVSCRFPFADSRKDLGNTLIHYLQSNAPIDGASDHGYSEALYLTDPEGNGIEVYRDKPKSEWDIREDGEIVGITKEMDAEGLSQQQTANNQVSPQVLLWDMFI